MNDLFQALAHPVRRSILKELRAGPMTAGELAQMFPVSKPTMSRHFATLKDAGLIQAERVGTSIRYRLNVSVAEEMLGMVMNVLGTGAHGSAQDDNDEEANP